MKKYFFHTKLLRSMKVVAFINSVCLFNPRVSPVLIHGATVNGSPPVGSFDCFQRWVFQAVPLWPVADGVRGSSLWQVYVSRGEQWINPDVSVAYQKKQIFLRNLASDISKIQTFCSTRKIEGKHCNYLP